MAGNQPQQFLLKGQSPLKKKKKLDKLYYAGPENLTSR